MNAQRFEYRVRWRRHGRVIQTLPSLRADAKPVEKQEPERTYSAIYQTEKAAIEKVERLELMDEEKYRLADESTYDRFDFPDLIGSPTIERRTVGKWEAA